MKIVKVVIDTNVFVSGVFWRSTPGQVLNLWLDGRFQLVLSREIFEEYERISKKLGQKYKSPWPDSIWQAIDHHAQFFEPTKILVPQCDDPKDQMFLELAVCANASYIVSGDDDLLRLKVYPGGKILGPGPFCSLFQP